HPDHIAQRLPDLAHEVVRLELAPRVPADLAGDEDELAPGDDAVRVPAPSRPFRRLEHTHRPPLPYRGSNPRTIIGLSRRPLLPEGPTGPWRRAPLHRRH